MKLGRFIVGQGTIPGGGDAYITHRVITAGEKPIFIQAGTWWGGDAGEYIKLAMIMPNAEGIGSKDIEHFMNSGNGIPVYDGNMEGALIPNTALPFFGTFQRSPFGGQFYLPPFCSIVAYASTANTEAWEIILAGYECESYAS